MKKNQRKPLALCSVGLLGLAGVLAMPVAAVAGPASTIYSPIVDYREWELELKGGMFNWGRGEESTPPAMSTCCGHT